MIFVLHDYDLGMELLVNRYTCEIRVIFLYILLILSYYSFYKSLSMNGYIISGSFMERPS